MIVAAASAWSQCTFRTQSRSAPYRTLFSMASLVLTVKAAGWVYAVLGGTSAVPFTVLSITRPLVGAATTYFVFNTLLIATAIGLSTRQPIFKVWNENFLWSAPSYFVGALASAVAASVIDRGGYWMASLAAAPLYLTYRTYKVYMGRIQDQQRHVAQVSDLHLATIEALALAIDAKDQTAQSHIRRVQVYAAGLARALGMPETEIQGVKTAALLHDIGKLAVPEHILSKPGPLTQEEFQKIRIHPQVGAEIISGVPFPYPVAPLDPQPSRALGRQGLSIRAEGRRDPARRAHPFGGRLLRRAHVGAPVPQGDGLRRRDWPAASGKPQGARPSRRSDVHRHVPRPGRGSRRQRRAVTQADAGADARANRRPGGRPGRRDVGAHQRLPGHRARAPRDLRALRNRAGDGQLAGRVRHHGADLVEVEQHRAVLLLRAVSLQRRHRDAALPLRDRRGSRDDPATHHSQRLRPDGLGGSQPAAARQRAPQHRPRSGRLPVGADDAAFGARVPAALQRAVHRDDLRLSHGAFRSIPTIIAGCSTGFPSRRPPSSTTPSSSSKRRKIRSPMR